MCLDLGVDMKRKADPFYGACVQLTHHYRSNWSQYGYSDHAATCSYA